MESYVYVILNTRNGKIYVGWTNNPKERWRKHRKNAELGMPYFLYRAMRKESSVFEFKVISNHFNESEAMRAERYWIRYFDSNTDKLGYNMTIGGEGCVIYGRRSWNKGLTFRQMNRKVSKASEEAIRNRVAARMQNLEPMLQMRKQEAQEMWASDSSRGFIKRLSAKWNVTHTQVRRFLSKHLPEI